MGMAVKVWLVRKKDGVQFCLSFLLCNMAVGKKQDLVFAASQQKGCLIKVYIINDL